MNIPHCPNPLCKHFNTPKNENWYRPHGSYQTKTFGEILRFQCRSCRRTFSNQTFSIDYYAKKKVDYEIIFNNLISASGNLDMSRLLQVRTETIQNRIERLSRVALAIQSDLLKILPFNENLAADGFESFSYSQFFPCHINSFVGSESEFVYSIGFANLKRKGRMTEKQKKKRVILEKKGKASPQAIENSMRILTKDFIQRFIDKGIKKKRTLHTDEHKAYTQAFAKTEGFDSYFKHSTISSKKARTVANPLFPVNYWDRQIRKDLSDHTRETLQHAKHPNAMMARCSVYRMHHNVFKARRVRNSRKGDQSTHAEAAGVSKIQLEKLVSSRWMTRPFLHTVDLNDEEKKTWLCKWSNPGFIGGRRIPEYISA